jgi:hypothetical protein
MVARNEPAVEWKIAFGKKGQPLKPRSDLLILSVSLVLYPMAYPLQAQPVQPRIDVVVVGGEGAINKLRQPVSQDPSVRIEDQNHQPVTGAVVTFNVPLSGTTGEFENGRMNSNVVTGADGLAVAKGLKTNDIPGRFQILITASYRGLTARSLINQTNQGVPGAKAHGGSGKLVAIVAIIAAAAAGGAIAATRNKGSSSSSSSGPSPPAPIGITPGTGTIAHP